MRQRRHHHVETDLHLTAAEGGRTWGSDVWRNLDAMLGLVRTLEPFDLLVLSGDLANQRRAATYARLRERLRPFAGRLRVLPGNHDSRRLLRAHFGDLLLQGAPAAVFVHELAGWRIVGLDSVRRPSAACTCLCVRRAGSARAGA